MLSDEEAKRERLRNIHWLEQLTQGIYAEEPDAIEEAKGVLARITLRGSPMLLGQVFRGMLLAGDEEQEEWDRLFPPAGKS